MKILLFSALGLLLANIVILIYFYCKAYYIARNADVEANDAKKNALMIQYAALSDHINKLEKGPIAIIILSLIIAAVLALVY